MCDELPGSLCGKRNVRLPSSHGVARCGASTVLMLHLSNKRSCTVLDSCQSGSPELMVARVGQCGLWRRPALGDGLRDCPLVASLPMITDLTLGRAKFASSKMNVLLLNNTARGFARLFLRQSIYKGETRTLNPLLKDLSLEGKTALVTGAPRQLVRRPLTVWARWLACLSNGSILHERE